MKANEEIDTLIRSVHSNRKDGIDKIAKTILQDRQDKERRKARNESARKPVAQPGKATKKGGRTHEGQ
jgi:hypothetical protein